LQSGCKSVARPAPPEFPAGTARFLRRPTSARPSRPAPRKKIVRGGFFDRYDYAQQVLKEIPYARWRAYDPEDTLRFYSLRLREVGMIKSTPNKIIAEGTEWRFWNDLKRELKS
jgi:NitT/TauT family transport system substrate-binding protein